MIMLMKTLIVENPRVGGSIPPLRASVLPCGSDYGLRGVNIPPKKGILFFAGAFGGK
jgi:hypothetical protein